MSNGGPAKGQVTESIVRGQPNCLFPSKWSSLKSIKFRNSSGYPSLVVLVIEALLLEGEWAVPPNHRFGHKPPAEPREQVPKKRLVHAEDRHSSSLAPRSGDFGDLHRSVRGAMDPVIQQGVQVRLRPVWHILSPKATKPMSPTKAPETRGKAFGETSLAELFGSFGETRYTLYDSVLVKSLIPYTEHNNVW